MPTNGYCSLAVAKAIIGVDSTNHDTLLDLAIGAASRQIDGYIGYRFWLDSAVVTREYFADDHQSLYIDEGISTTAGLIVKLDEDGDGTFETTLSISTDYILKPTNAPDMIPVQPWTEVLLADNYRFPILSNGRPGVQITATFGWPAIPDDVTMACALLANDLFKSKDAPFGVAGAAEFGVLRVTGNRTVMNLLAPYRKVSVG